MFYARYEVKKVFGINYYNYYYNYYIDWLIFILWSANGRSQNWSAEF
jgi:hypothetical protein